MAVHLGVRLCHLFGRDLDRKTLWERIGSAFRTAAAKCDDGDTDRFVSLCLDHVKADDSMAATDAPLMALIDASGGRTLAWRQGFVRYVASHVPAVLGRTKAAWEDVKAQNATTREAVKNA